jgi:translation initiation factor IF-3
MRAGFANSPLRRLTTGEEHHLSLPPRRPSINRSLPPPQKEHEHKINNRIEARELRLIGADGQNVGVVPTRQALIMADEAGLDLVEISPDAKPPVAKILDYGKFRFQEQKKAAEARKKQKVIELKEIKLRPMIDDHDFEVKMKQARRFFEEGDKVKFTLRFRGREMDHQDLGYKLLIRVREQMMDVSKVELDPKPEGRQITMIMTAKGKG